MDDPTGIWEQAIYIPEYLHRTDVVDSKEAVHPFSVIGLLKPEWGSLIAKTCDAGTRIDRHRLKVGRLSEDNAKATQSRCAANEKRNEVNPDFSTRATRAAIYLCQVRMVHLCQGKTPQNADWSRTLLEH